MSTENAGRLAGERLVTTLYLGVVGFAAVFGALLGVILPAKENFPAAAQFGPISFPINPLTFAVYGAVNVAIGLGVLLLLVRYVSRKFPDA